MCKQYYESYNLCPCQLKRGALEKCADPDCRSVSKPVYSSNKPYCAYHARAHAGAGASHKLIFPRMDVPCHTPTHTSLSIPASAPVLGRVPLSTAFAGSESDFGKRVVAYDDSSDDDDLDCGKKFPVNQERRDFSREEDRAELAKRREEFWAKAETTTLRRRDPWGELGAPLKTGREKSRTWVEWKKFRRAKEEKEAKEKENGKGCQRPEEEESNSTKEESQLLSTTELEEFEAMALSDAVTLELLKPHSARRDSKRQGRSPSSMTESTRELDSDDA